MFHSRVTRIEPRQVWVKNSSHEEADARDAGFRDDRLSPRFRVSRTAGHSFETRVDAKPEINPETLESNVPGIYVAGVVVGGKAHVGNFHRERPLSRPPNHRCHHRQRPNSKKPPLLRPRRITQRRIEGTLSRGLDGMIRAQLRNCRSVVAEFAQNRVCMFPERGDCVHARFKLVRHSRWQ